MTVRRAYPFAIVFICFLVFGVTVGGEFLSWDDAQHFHLNSHLVAGDAGFFWQNAYYGFFAPVTYTVWTALYAWSRDAWIFHLLNLVLHAGNCLLVFALAKRILNGGERGAFFSALVFALHPLQTETVAWISGGRDLLSAFLGLSAAYLLARPIRHPASLAFATPLFTLGMLAKPSLAPLPVALWILDSCRRGEALFNRAVLALWTAIGAIVLGYTYLLQAPLADPRLAVNSVFARAIVAVDALGFYARAFAWPFPLSFNYGRQIEFALENFAWGAASVAAALVILFLLARRFGRLVAGAGLFALLLLSPVLGLIPFAGQVQSTVFDRYMYLPVFGLALILGLLSETRRARIALFALLVIGAGLSFARAREWRSNRSLFESALAADSANYIALNNLAILEISEKNYARAESLLRTAWEARPKEALAPANLAHVLWLRNNVGAVLAEIKPLTETEIFLRYNAREIESLALIHRMTARALNATLDRAGAAQSYRRAMEYRPDDLELMAEVRKFEAEK